MISLKAISSRWQGFGLLNMLKSEMAAGSRLIQQADRKAAFITILLAGLCGGIILFVVDPSNDRLSHFRPEQIVLYAVKDSYPQRLAYIVYLAVLVAGAVTARWWEGALDKTSVAVPSLFILAAMVLCSITPPFCAWRYNRRSCRAVFSTCAHCCVCAVWVLFVPCCFSPRGA
jgi:hypothetical protein